MAATIGAEEVPRRPLRLGFAGTPDFAVPALEALAGSRHSIVAVYTQPDRPSGRGRRLHTSPIKTWALGHSLPVHQPSSFAEHGACEELDALGLDVLVVAAYGIILPRAALDSPRLGCFNIHASLLPRWRGAAPIQRAILAGDRATGISIMRMEEGLDTGPVLAVRALPIETDDTAGSLHERLASLGAELIRSTVESIAAGRVPETPQPLEGVTYAAKIRKAEALIDWHEDREHVLRKVRAFNPLPVAETRWRGEQLRIWEASPGCDPSTRAVPGTVLAAGADGIEVACGRGSVRLERLQLAGRRAVSAAELARGSGLIGARLTTA